ncbi:uncharacterized protein BXIN_1462 [Babesia sp. Xinjiang]|uniref:uncharacterized protein n=1 Tax=Babesia sp. Xinjiang TaxID=462227 RepID=UPI000A22549F|nr:uncharacterized protein BXIN_1462 [Babesia sp. Xinjiang]ORM40041.1 hypothetical protein BXIN_1462 [Babesia sp. Xinjiang]
MDFLPSHLMTVPVPCAALAIDADEYEKLREYMLVAGRANNNNHNRLNVIVLDGFSGSDGNTEPVQWEPDIPSHSDWVFLQRRMPPVIVCVRDWQHYVVDSSWAATAGDDVGGESNDSVDFQDEDPHGQTSVHRGDSGEAQIIRGDMKQLADLIKSDVERCLGAYRRNLLDKRPVAGKIMFLIVLREGTKNAQKAVNSLKNLNANEVAAVCVTSGELDIANKVGKLEQLMYDHSIAYYERRSYLLSKTLSKVKPSAGATVDETSEINAAMTNFKLAYFQQFTGNFKDSAQTLVQAWSHIVPAATANPSSDYASVALYIALQLIGVHFACSNIVDALTSAFEAGAFFKRVLYSDPQILLYHNLCYLLYHSVALHLEKAVDYKEIKANDHLRHHAVNFAKWAIQHLIKMRIAIMSNEHTNEPERSFATLLMRGDDDFSHLYSSVASECTNQTVKQRLHKLESITEELLVRLMDMLSTWSWYNTLVEVTELLGDSLLLSGNLKQACFIYSNIGDALVNSTTLEAEYLLKSCTSPVISEALKHSTTSRSTQTADSPVSKEHRLQPNFPKSATVMILAEHGHAKIWFPIYKRILTKMMMTINMMLDFPVDIPVSLLLEADIPSVVCDDQVISASSSSCMATGTRDYALILLKSLLTLYSITNVVLDFDSLCSRLVSGILDTDIVSSILLSKNHTPFYVLGQEEKNDNMVATKLQVVITFHVDLPFSIEVNRVTICTSIGTFVFDISYSECHDGHVEIYFNPCTGMESDLSKDIDTPSDDDVNTVIVEDTLSYPNLGSNKVLIDGHRRVILAITFPPINNKFMIDSFSLLGVRLHWTKVMCDGTLVDIACIIPSLVKVPRRNACTEDPLFIGDDTSGTFRLLDYVENVGSSRSTLKADDILQMTMVGSVDPELHSTMAETILELTKPTHMGFNISELTPSDGASVSYVRGAYRMFVNRIYFKVFLGNIVEGHVAPVSCVLLFNKQILGADTLGRIKFSVEVTSTASSHIYYALCRDEDGKTGVMRQCLNNKICFTLTEFADSENFEVDPQLESQSVSENETVVPTLFAENHKVNCSINEDMRSFLDLVKRDDNTGVVYIYGLLKVLSHGPTNIQFSLQMQPMLGHTLKAVESKLLVVTDVTETFVHEPISMDLNHEQVYNNTFGGFLRLLNMYLSNRSPLDYEIHNVRVLYDGAIAASNDQLYGFCNHLDRQKSIQFMHMFAGNDNCGSAVEVQCVHSVVHPDAFPFDRLRPSFQNLITVGLYTW